MCLSRSLLRAIRLFFRALLACTREVCYFDNLCDYFLSPSLQPSPFTHTRKVHYCDDLR